MNLTQLNLLPVHTGRLYFRVHDTCLKKIGGDVRQACAILCIGLDGNICQPLP